MTQSLFEWAEAQTAQAEAEQPLDPSALAPLGWIRCGLYLDGEQSWRSPKGNLFRQREALVLAAAQLKEGKKRG
jgi:hypothetical protein